jgi:hypothetical protein
MAGIYTSDVWAVRAWAVGLRVLGLSERITAYLGWLGSV